MTSGVFQRKYYLLIILFFSFLTRFLFWNHPQEIVFDESGYLNHISAYYTREFTFDLHPPLFKLLLAGFGKLFRFNPNFSLNQINGSEIDKNFPNKDYLPLRLLPMLAGALLPLVVFLTAKEIGLSERASLAASLLLILDNALIVQSRFILAESLLLFFGMLCLYFYFRYRRTQSWTDLILASVLGSLAFSIKWTGGSFVALAFLLEIFWLVKKERLKKWKEILRILFVFIILPLFIYFSIFVIHFSLLVKKGPGDVFMTPAFQSQNVFRKFIELNRALFISNQQHYTHPYASKWYTWPLGLQPVYYWVKEGAQIYLMGNPIIWWASTASLLVLLFYFGLQEVIKDRIKALLLGAYLLNFLPFIAIKRIMFLYHYFPALIFAILILVYLIDSQKSAKVAFMVLVIFALAGFIYFAPVTYGFPRYF